MIVLDGTTDAIQAFMGGAAATTNPSFFISYADVGAAFTPANASGALNGTTDVDLVTGDATNTRLVKTITICNIDTADVVLTVQFNDGTDDRVLIDAVTIPPGNTLFYSAETGWLVQPEGAGGTPTDFNGDRLLATVQFTASDTFDKADYPGIAYIDVQMVGAGGAGGGADDTGATQISVGGGGGSGEYARGVILEGDLAASETVTIGAGGVPVAGGSGGDGGNTSLGSHISANGGEGGINGGATGSDSAVRGGVGGNGGTGGDIQVKGQPGSPGWRNNTAQAIGGHGGASFFGGAGVGLLTNNGGAGDFGEVGGGGGGAANNNSRIADEPGGVGGDGYMLIRVYGE